MKKVLTETSIEDLTAVLVHLAHQRGFNIEHLRAEQLLVEAQQAWPGTWEESWAKWFAEAAKSLGLRARIAEMPIRKALELVEDGAMTVTSAFGKKRLAVITAFDGRRANVVWSDQSDNEKLTPRKLHELAAETLQSEVDVTGICRWIVIQDLDVSHDAAHAFHDRPIARFFALLKPEWSDIWVVGVFAFLAGLLSLATPIAVESLVNIVAFGRLLQPLLILSIMLFGFLAFASTMQALQTFVVEIIQRRIFARVAADLAYRFPRVAVSSLEGHYGPELANRFFDTVTLQKVVAQLLLDGLAIVLATTVGMAVLAFYHPWLLGFDVLLLLLVVGGIVTLGRGAIDTGIDESRQKYRLAAWLEDLIRCPISFKYSGAAEFAIDRANQITTAYLNSRRAHFRVLFRQLLFVLGLQAVAGTVLLGFGGWLVIRGQLTLGQLVAAELIVATILGSLAKLGKHIEGFYDVIASVDKLGHLFELDIESQDGLLAFRPLHGAGVRITEVTHSEGGPALQDGFSLQLESGDRMALLSSGAAGGLVLFDLLYGLRTPESGHIEIEEADPRDVRLDVLRRAVTLVRDVEIFEGTVAENIHLSRPGVSMTDVRNALLSVGLLDRVLRLPQGLDTKLFPATHQLLPSELHLLMIARGLAGEPQLLLIDGTLDSLADTQLVQVCRALVHNLNDCTLIVATNRPSVAKQFPEAIELDDGVETVGIDFASPQSEAE